MTEIYPLYVYLCIVKYWGKKRKTTSSYLELLGLVKVEYSLSIIRIIQTRHGRKFCINRKTDESTWHSQVDSHVYSMSLDDNILYQKLIEQQLIILGRSEFLSVDIGLNIQKDGERLITNCE